MESFPESIQQIVAECAAKYKNDIDKAVDQAVSQVQALDDYEDFVDLLVRTAVRGKITDFRHSVSTAIKRAAGEYGGPAKVGTDLSAVNAVARGVFDYFIGGRTLGTITGEELKQIRDSEAEKATGHLFNAGLCEALIPLVQEGKTVRECVAESKVRRIFKTIQAGGAVVNVNPISPVPRQRITRGKAESPLKTREALPSRKTKVTALAGN